jgi:hypothetical protein
VANIARMTEMLTRIKISLKNLREKTDSKASVVGGINRASRKDWNKVAQVSA